MVGVLLLFPALPYDFTQFVGSLIDPENLILELLRGTAQVAKSLADHASDFGETPRPEEHKDDKEDDDDLACSRTSAQESKR